jgi:hypothetical protein
MAIRTDGRDCMEFSLVAAVVGIVASAVSDNPRTNVADGGADTEVSAQATLADPWGYFGVRSVWQYKAVELGSLRQV